MENDSQSTSSTNSSSSTCLPKIAETGARASRQAWHLANASVPTFPPAFFDDNLFYHVPGLEVALSRQVGHLISGDLFTKFRHTIPGADTPPQVAMPLAKVSKEEIEYELATQLNW